MVEFGAETAPDAESQARSLMRALTRNGHPPNMRLCTDKQQLNAYGKSGNRRSV